MTAVAEPEKVYDSNGNRTITGYTTGDHNRLLTDGTYTYQYDNEGNRTARFVDNDSSGTLNSGDTSITEYEWDHRNRLTKVTERSTYGGAATKIVEYAYDYGQRWVRKTLDTDADATIESSRIFVHDSGQIVLGFEKTGTGDAANSDLSHRYLWDPTNVDAIVADETVDDGTADDVAWTLTDHLNSVRDLVVYDPVTQTVSVVKHVVYDAYGNVTSDTATGVESLFLYTARPFDFDTELQNNLNRWYDLSTGRWMSVDPIGFEAGDVNLYRYCRNSATHTTDPRGLWMNGWELPGQKWGPPDMSVELPIEEVPFPDSITSFYSYDTYKSYSIPRKYWFTDDTYECPCGMHKSSEQQKKEFWVTLKTRSGSWNGHYDGFWGRTEYLFQGTINLQRKLTMHYALSHCEEYHFFGVTYRGTTYHGPCILYGGFHLENVEWEWGAIRTTFSGKYYAGEGAFDPGAAVSVIDLIIGFI